MNIGLFKIAATILLLISSSEGIVTNTWTTEESLQSGKKVKLHWSSVYEGYHTVYKLELLESNQPVRTLKVVGQPVFNEDETLLALPNCWHGGCEKIITIVDMLAFEELEPIKLDREAFLECSWNKRKLTVYLGKTHPGGVSESQIYEFP